MTHFTVMVRYEGDIENVEKEVERLLEPFDENKNVPKYKEYISKESWNRALEHFKIPQPLSPSGVTIVEPELTPKQFKDYFGETGGKDEKGHFHWTTYNPQSKWDWYQIGGRWEGMLKLKEGTKGKSGTRSLLVDKETAKKPLGTDIAYVKDVDWERMGAEEREEYAKYWDALIEKAEVGKDLVDNPFELNVLDEETLEKFIERAVGGGFATHAVVDEKGWHEPSKMGWWGMDHDRKENQDTWESKFKERFLLNVTDKTVIALVDCHI